MSSRGPSSVTPHKELAKGQGLVRKGIQAAKTEEFHAQPDRSAREPITVIMRIDPAAVFSHTVFSIPWRLMLCLVVLIAGMLSRMAFDENGLEYFSVTESIGLFPVIFTEAALASGLWSLLAGPLLIASIWLIIVFAYDGADGIMTLFALYVFSYLITMFRGRSDSILALLFGVGLVVALVVAWMRKRRAEIAT